MHILRIAPPAFDAWLEKVTRVEDDLFYGESWGTYALRNELAHGRLYVATNESDLQGYAVVRSGWLPDLVRLGVRRDQHGRGTGSALLEAVVADHPKRIMLTVRHANPNARRLYERFGFRVQGTLARSWVMVRNDESETLPHTHT